MERGKLRQVIIFKIREEIMTSHLERVPCQFRSVLYGNLCHQDGQVGRPGSGTQLPDR